MMKQKFEQLSVQEEVASSQATQPMSPSSRSIRVARRPGQGTVGTKCLVKANHLFAKLHDKDIRQYNVSITPVVTSWSLNRAIMNQLVASYQDSHLDKMLLAYDGGQVLYTAGPHPFPYEKLKITLLDEDDGSGSPRREREFTVVIKSASLVDLDELKLFLQGRHAPAAQKTLQVLNIVLREQHNASCSLVGQSFYPCNLGSNQPLGEGLESWCGFYQSIRPTQMGLSLNVDTSYAAFIKPLPVIEFVTELLNKDVSSQTLSVADCVKIKKFLIGVKVEVTHRENVRRKYRISDLTSQATHELTFPIGKIGMIKSVVDYFRETYGFEIQHKELPCLQMGNPHRPSYIPMEVCKIVEKQRYSKTLNAKQIIALLNFSCKHPKDREKHIMQVVKNNAYDKDQYAEKFGIKISNKLALVQARILPTPWLKYHETGGEKRCLPRVGKWSMVNKKLVNGGKVHNWICINFSSEVRDNVAEKFCFELAQKCRAYGMDYNLEPVLPVHRPPSGQVEKVLKPLYHNAMTKLHPLGKELDLLIVILPEKRGVLYGAIKRICETDLGLVSQCCLKEHVLKLPEQYLGNVALKINVKVGGRNTVLADAISRKISFGSDVPTIIFGADVTHSHAGGGSSPSIAAVVASQDWPEITKYVGLVSAQASRKELIQDLFKEWEDPQRGTVSGGMIKELLLSFKKTLGVNPKRIIFYRDGVGEGEFYQVLLHELNDIRKACNAFEANYRPPITYVVVQKRHHTRLFANNHNDRNAVDWTGNILPGTVVDSMICHPSEFDFYLCSHAGKKGTSRPAHYHVLWDENKFTSDNLQSLTYNLCYTYARCTQSVSIVAPVYYAHLAAFRARYYVEPETPNGMGGAGTSTRAPSDVPVRPLPALKEKIKRVMFYC